MYHLAANKRAGCLILWLWLAMVSAAPAKPGLDTGNPIGFFTTVADKLLHSTFNFGVTNIPVYTNGVFVYTPAVQRLLQLSANIYDATTNRTAVFGKDYPSVFRPLFSATAAGDLFITGYTNVASVSDANDLVFSMPFDAAVVAAAGSSTNVPVNIYGVPWIIGAKKGFPSFNQFYMLNAVEVTRKLQITRPISIADPTPGLSEYRTNQMYIFSISNTLGCSLWNSYTSAYSGNLTILARDTISMELTDDAGSPPIGYLNAPIANNIFTVTYWPGADWQTTPPNASLYSMNSFLIPFNVPLVFMTNSIYRYAGASSYFDPFNMSFQTDVLTPPLPQFGLLTSNRLQVAILEGDANNVNHVIDYVHFAGPNSSRNLNVELADPAINDLSGNLYMWSTNYSPFGSPGVTPMGVVNQIIVSEGKGVPVYLEQNSWQAAPNMPAGLPFTVSAVQAWFNAFFNVNRLQYGRFAYNGKIYYNTNASVQAPYIPTRMLYDYESWQANDPLVHFLVSDLSFVKPGVTGIQRSDDLNNFLPPTSLSNVSARWSPWGQTYAYPGGAASRVNATYLASMKDPLMWRPDDWDFPAGQDWSLAALGRIHRGTPWQTVYLKSSDVIAASGNTGLPSWAEWTGDTDYNDALLTTPINDWRLMGLLLPLLSTNDPTQLMSVNNPNLADWLNALNGLVVTTNSAPDSVGYVIPSPPDAYIMTSNSPQALFIANAIAQARTSQPGQLFQSIGALLQTAALAENSPWLNWNNPYQQQNGVSDEAYEAVANQLLPLLRPDSVGAVVPTNGGWSIQFSGSDSYTYVLQTSTNLINWEVASTNSPTQGSFTAPVMPTTDSHNRFYRSLLVP
jgi:hypothetical protein